MTQLVRLLQSQDCNHAKYLRLLKTTFFDLGDEVFNCFFQDTLLERLLQSLSSNDLHVLKEAVYALAHIFKNNMKSVVQHHSQIFDIFVRVFWTHSDPHVRRFMIELVAYLIQKKTADKVQAKMIYCFLKMVVGEAMGSDEGEMERAFEKFGDFVGKVMFESLRGFMNCLTPKFSGFFKNFVSAFNQMIKSFDKVYSANVQIDDEKLKIAFSESSQKQEHCLSIMNKNCSKNDTKKTFFYGLLATLSQIIRGCLDRFAVHEFSFRFKRSRQSDAQKPFEHLFIQLKRYLETYKNHASLHWVLRRAYRLALQDLFYFKNAFFFKNNKQLKKLLVSEIREKSLGKSQIIKNHEEMNQIEVFLDDMCRVRMVSLFATFFTSKMTKGLWDFLHQTSLFRRILKELLFSTENNLNFRFLSKVIQEELKKNPTKYKLPEIDESDFYVNLTSIIYKKIASIDKKTKKNDLLYYQMLKNIQDKKRNKLSLEEVRIEDIVTFLNNDQKLNEFGCSQLEQKSIDGIYLLLSFLEAFPLIKVDESLMQKLQIIISDNSNFTGLKTIKNGVNLHKFLQMKLQKLNFQQEILKLNKNANDPSFTITATEKINAFLQKHTLSPLSNTPQQTTAENIFFAQLLQSNLNLKVDDNQKTLFSEAARILLRDPQKHIRQKGLSMLQKLNQGFLNQSLSGLKNGLKQIHEKQKQKLEIDENILTDSQEISESSFSTLTLLDLLQDVLIFLYFLLFVLICITFFDKIIIC